MELKENTVVADRFRLMRMIGRGGMGSVWQAQDCRLDNQCAVKFIEGELANVADAHARFEREAKAAAQLRSPHVVEIKDYGVWQGRPYIAMELLEGEDLGRALSKAGGKLPPAHANSVIQQVCRALTKAHQAGIVHRDLKPDNIFLVTDDDRQLVKILDFGVAKSTGMGIEGSNTKTGAMLGTPYYMSPEQAQGIKSVDSRSDLWSLAVIVYHCITGRLPFESEALGDLLVKIIVSPVPVPSQIAQVPPGFDRWWAKAADRNPDGRFPTAKEFGAALALALGATAETQTRAQLTGTAMMPGVMNAQTAVTGPSPNVPTAAPTAPSQGGQGQAPQYQQHPSGMGQTPNPAHQGPPTPAAPMMSPARPGSVPPAGHPSLGGTGHPATFSGVEPPFVVPKKGPPIAVIAGVAALAVIGVVLGGFALSKRGGSTTTTTGGTSVVASTATSATATPTDSATAATTETAASASAAPTAAEPASTASAASAAATAASAAATTTSATTASPAKTAANTGATTGATTAATTKPVSKPAAPASAKKFNLGF